MNRKNQVEEVHYHHHNDWLKFIKEFFIFMLILICVGNFWGLVNTSVSEDKTIYGDCVDACSINKYEGTNHYCSEYDKTECVKSCNDLYLLNKGIKTGGLK